MAANKLLFWILMFWSIRRTASAIAGEGRITITPEKLVLAHDKVDEGGIVTVKCEAVNLGTDEKLSNLYISRQVASSSEKKTLVGDFGNGIIPPTESGMSATGGVSSNQLTLRMEQTKCQDTGNYSCTVYIVPQSLEAGLSPKKDEKMVKLEVEVGPANISLIADPDFELYTVNETVTLKCNGIVGTVVEGTTQLAWVWQYRSGNFPSSSWQTVNENHAHVHDVGSPIKEKCYEMRQSWLVRNLTTEDTNRVYRCYVNWNGEPYDQFAAMHTIGTVREAETTTQGAGPSGGGGSQPDKADVGMIIGIVIGVLVIIIVVIVIVVFVIRRKKANKEEDVHVPDYDTNKPGDDPNAPPFTTEPGVVYSQPNRFRNDRETGKDGEWERGKRVNAQGLHYADLDLVREPPSDETTGSVASGTTSTEYASIRLY